MGPDEFLKISRDKIKDDPFSRLSESVRSEIKKSDCLIDIHAHIFDKKCLTVGYILLRLLKSKILESIGLESFKEDSLLTKNEDEIYEMIESQKHDTSGSWEKLDSEIENVLEISESCEIFGFDMKEAINVLKKKSMIEILDYYLNNFSLRKVADFTGRPFLTGVLLMDLETGWDIRPEKKLSRQVDEIKEIMQTKQIIPFFPLDPRRANLEDPDENLYTLFLKAFTGTEPGFFGVKCYPSLGYLPGDLRLDPVFRICSEKKIPVITHCGGEIVSTFHKEIEFHDSAGTSRLTIPGKCRTERAGYLNDPELWLPVINRYNNLKLCFSHFGGDSNWKNFSLNNSNERINRIINMMKNPRYSVFADFSYNLVEKELYRSFGLVMDKNPELLDKVMFGTDYWVVLPAGDLLDMQEEFLKQMTKHLDTLLNKAPINFLLS